MFANTMKEVTEESEKYKPRSLLTMDTTKVDAFTHLHGIASGKVPLNIPDSAKPPPPPPPMGIPPPPPEQNNIATVIGTRPPPPPPPSKKSSNLISSDDFTMEEIDLSAFGLPSAFASTKVTSRDDDDDEFDSPRPPLRENNSWNSRENRDRRNMDDGRGSDWRNKDDRRGGMMDDNRDIRDRYNRLGGQSNRGPSGTRFSEPIMPPPVRPPMSRSKFELPSIDLEQEEIDEEKEESELQQQQMRIPTSNFSVPPPHHPPPINPPLPQSPAAVAPPPATELLGNRLPQMSSITRPDVIREAAPPPDPVHPQPGGIMLQVRDGARIISNFCTSHHLIALFTATLVVSECK